MDFQRGGIRNPLASSLVLLLLLCLSGIMACSDDDDTDAVLVIPSWEVQEMRIDLSPPEYTGQMSLEESLLQRRSIRDYSDHLLSLEEVSQLLWAAQGVTTDWGGRTAPSAGGLYPLEVYAAVGNVKGLPAGVYRYDPREHQLALLISGDIREQLAMAALDQEWVIDAAVDLVITVVYQRTTRKYGERGIRYVHMEAGHAAQNICLQATSLGLGAVSIGAFHDEGVRSSMRLPEGEEPLYIISVGRPL